ncbi:MAG: AglZ/HisF2 family acetamidino modification protein [Thermodesulfobacteriota bacterium]
MLKIRVIPFLLLKNRGLVKTVRFEDPVYIGDPINAVKIFNDKEVDELVFLDITATIEKRKPNFNLIADLASECFMPFGYGGGIRDLNDIKRIFSLGVEKVIINSFAAESPTFIKMAAELFGSQSIVVSIDVRRNLFGKYIVYTHGGRMATKLEAVTFAKQMEEMGAGEILLTSIDHDGKMIGYDVELIKNVTSRLTIPVIAAGGAGRIQDFSDAIKKGGAAAVSAGSMFVFHGRHRAVLISYPGTEELEMLG